MKPALRVADVCNPGRSRGAGEVFLQDQRMVPGRILRSVQQRNRTLTGDPADEVAHGRRGAQFRGIPAAEFLPPLPGGGMEPCTQPGGRSDLLRPQVIAERLVEISLNGDILRNLNGWSWSLGGNIGFNKSKIGDLGFAPTDFGTLKNVRGYQGTSIGDHFGIANLFIAGEAPGLFFGYKTQGIIQPEDIVDGKVAYTAADGSTKYYSSSVANDLGAGNIKAVDMNEDGVVDEKDKTILGNPNPDFTYGFQTRIAWKDLSVSASFNGVHGNQILNTNIRYYTPSRQAGNLTQEAFRNIWTEENHSNLYPSATANVKNVVYDRYIEDGSYLRCSDITLNYTLPKSWMKKIGFQNIGVFASVKNAFVITNYSGYDPEINSFAFDGLRPGIDMNAFPSQRSYVFGLNVTF